MIYLLEFTPFVALYLYSCCLNSYCCLQPLANCHRILSSYTESIKCESKMIGKILR